MGLNWLARYQVAVVGSKTPGANRPWPVQSPATGIQPGAPYLKGVMSGAPGPAVSRRYQVLVAGSTTPMPVWPAPVQSPTTGSQPGAPYRNAAMSGAPG